jgi:hypothetical protein
MEMSVSAKRIAGLFFAVVGAAMMTACDNTNYAPGFSKEKFATVQMGDSVDEVKAKLGEPIRSVMYAKEGFQGKVFGDELYSIISFGEVKKASADSRVFVELEYSLQSNSHRPYRLWRITIAEGRVNQRTNEMVGD